MDLDLRIKKLHTLILSRNRILVLTGAGISTESGLPDFRSPESAAACLESFGHLPEDILSAGCFAGDPGLFYAYYRTLCAPAKPNPAHEALYRLEKSGRLLSILTQNIDGLHQKAGCGKVLELHGSTREYRCTSCGHYCTERTLPMDSVPRCPSCGGIYKPDITLYDEPLNEYVLNAARARMFAADLLIIAGTPLSVAPAADLPQYYMGKDLVIINRTKTPLDAMATLRFYESCGEILSAAVP